MLRPLVTRAASALCAAIALAAAGAAPAQPASQASVGPRGTTASQVQTSPVAASDAAPNAARRRPRTCLVLSGGGARGLAHIGVLRWLEAERIPVDCIAGTSMGAVIGSLYASGLSPARIAETMQELDWVALRLGPDERADRPARRREEDHVYTLPLDIEVTGGRALLPGSLLGADLFESQLRRWLGQRGDDTVFDRLPIPLRVVATRLGSGEQATFERGDLVRAVRASMSAPGLFPPARIGAGLYVDGGLVDNLPIDVARRMGADRVIAVDIGTKAADERDVRTVLDVTMQMLTLLTDQNVRAQLATLAPQDVLITPELGTVSFMDFLRAPEAIAAGGRIPADTARRLREMAVSPQEWERHTLARAERVLANLPRDDLRAADAAVAATVPHSAAAQPLAAGAAAETPGGGQASDPLATAGAESTAALRPAARADAADDSTRIRFGLSLGTDFTTGYFRVAGGLAQPLGDGTEWRSRLELGRVQRVSTDLWMPVGGAALVPYADVSRSQLPLYVGRVKILDGEVERAALGLDAGVADRWGGEWRAGPLLEWVRTGSGESGLLRVDTASGQLDVDRPGTSTARYISLRSRYQLDTLDAALLPRHGLRVTAEVTGGRATAGESGSYRFGSIDAQGVHTVGRDTFELAGQAGQYFGASREALPRWFTLGGFLRLSGYTPDSLAGSDVRFIRAQWRRQVAGLTPLGYRVWFGASAEAGRISEPLIDLGQLPQRTARALTLYAAMETPLGPVWLGAGIPRDGPARLYLFLGQP